MDKKNLKVVVKMNEVDQSVFIAGKTGISPVQNALGKQGWTIIDLKSVRKSLLRMPCRPPNNTVAPNVLG